MKTLTARQEGFAVAVAMGSTKADAYRKHYKTEGWSPQAVSEAANRVATLPHISARIVELSTKKAEVAQGEFDMTVRKLLQTYFEIAFTDPNDLTSMRVGACRHCWGEDGLYQWKDFEYEEALADWQRRHHTWEMQPGTKRGDEPQMPDLAGGLGFRFTREPNPHCKKCEGEGVERMRIQDTTKLSPGALHLYRGVQKTKDGIKILFGDKDKSLENIGRILGAFDDRLRLDLKGTVAAIGLTTTDPVEAASLYERMLTAPSS